MKNEATSGRVELISCLWRLLVADLAHTHRQTARLSLAEGGRQLWRASIDDVASINNSWRNCQSEWQSGLQRTRRENEQAGQPDDRERHRAK